MADRKVVLVTGGSSGIGLATASAFVARGDDVAIIARNPERLAQAESTLQSLRVSPDQRIASRIADLSDEVACRAAVESLLAEGFDPDVLVNSAGVIVPGVFTQMSSEDFARNIESGFWSVVHPCRAVAPRMERRGSGHIVNVSSVAGYLAVYGYTGYSSAKFAVMGFTEALRCELKPSGVAVSVVCPPDTDTPGLAYEKTLRPPETASISGSIAPISAEKVAHAIVSAVDRRRYLVIPDALSAFYFRLKGLVPELFWAITDGDVRKVRRSR